MTTLAHFPHIQKCIRKKETRCRRDITALPRRPI